MTDVTSWIDLYCERTAFGIWGEPFNTVSNLAFVGAAIAGVWALQRRGRGTLAEWLLTLLAAVIGVGSTIFHVWPVHDTELADVIPIWSFVALYLLTAIHRATGNARRTAVIALFAGIAFTLLFSLTSGDVTTEATAQGGTAETAFNGSLQYAPALAALMIFAIIMQIRQHPARGYITAAAVTFLISLGFRSIGLNTCTATHGLGTHWLWHLLNGTMIGLLLLALIRKMPQRGVPIP